MEHNLNILGLIPARGGSKGIKNKNIAPLAGKPLISYVIETMKQSRYIGRVVCTTDSEVIAEAAREYGAEVPFMRPAALATDAAAVYPALVHALQELERLEQYKPDYIVLVQATSPLTTVEQIDATIEKVLENNADSAITAEVLPHDCHPYNIREMSPDGSVHFWMEKEHYQFPSRQSKPTFYKFGNTYVTSYDTLVNKGRLEGEKNYIVPIEDQESVMDINTPADLEAIEKIMKRRNAT